MIALEEQIVSFVHVFSHCNPAVTPTRSALPTGMIAGAGLARQGQRALKCCRSAHARRQLATAASGSFNYETGEAAGVKLASRDLPGPTTHLAVVAKAGSRFQPLPGYSDGLEKFAFKKTYKRSALRITRESELLGGQLSATHSRENLIISAKFLRDDLPYFAELLGEVISQTMFTGEQSRRISKMATNSSQCSSRTTGGSE